eukprot:IDg21147t1
MVAARKKYEKIVAKRLISRGPHLIASVNGKEARIYTGDNIGLRFLNIAQLHPAEIKHTKEFKSHQKIENEGPPHALYTEIVQFGDSR